MINKYANKKKNIFVRAVILLVKKGLKQFSVDFLDFSHRKILNAFSPLIVYIKPKKFFIFLNQKLPYFNHKYNLAWKNERTIEVPLVWSVIKNYHGKNILEVGNVLSHYFSVNYDILDKYEKSRGVVNKDVVDFKPSHKYDLIVSISTLEHVGFDDSVNDPTKIIKAIKNLRENCLKLGGKMIITMPIGYNPEMDALLFTDKLSFDKEFYFDKYKRNEWKEIPKREARTSKYQHRFNVGANAIVIGIIIK